MSNFWDETAFSYDYRHEPPRTKYLRKEELKILKKYCFGNVVDLGCGSGFPLIELEKAGLRVFGFDSSIEMLKILKKKSQNSIVCLGDCNHLPIKFADCIVSTLSFLNYYENYEKIIKQISNLLKPDGKVILSVISKNDAPTPKLMKVHKKSIKVFGFDFNEIKNSFEKFRFKLIEAKGLFLFTNPKWGNFEPISLKEKFYLFLERFFSKIFVEKGKLYILVFKK